MLRLLSLATAITLLASTPTFAKRVAPKPAEPLTMIASVQGVDKDKKTITVAIPVTVTKFVAVTKKVVGADGKAIDVVEMVPVQEMQLRAVVYDASKAKFTDLEGTAIDSKDVFSKIEKGDNIGIAQGGKLGDVAPLKEKKVKVVMFPSLPEPK